MSFDPQVLQLLQGTNLYHATIERRAMTEGRARAVHQWLRTKWPQQAAAFSTRKYVWATEMLSSRAFTSKLLRPGSVIQPRDGTSAPDCPMPTTTAVATITSVVGAETAPAPSPSAPPPPPPACLVPLFDLFDHSPSADVAWRTTEAHVELWTREAIAPGQQIYSNYGQKGNEELMLAYGFALPDNAHNDFHLVLGVPLSATQGDGVTSKLLSSLGALSPRGLRLSLLQSDVPQSTTRLLQALSLVMYGKPHLFSPQGGIAIAIATAAAATTTKKLERKGKAPAWGNRAEEGTDMTTSSVLLGSVSTTRNESIRVGAGPHVADGGGGWVTGEDAFATRAVLQQASEVLAAKMQQYAGLLGACEEFARSLTACNDTTTEGSSTSTMAPAATSLINTSKSSSNSSSSSKDSRDSNSKGTQAEMARRFLRGQCRVLQLAREHIEHVHVAALALRLRPSVCPHQGRKPSCRGGVQQGDVAGSVRVLTLEALARLVPDVGVILSSVQGLEPEVAFALSLLTPVDMDGSTAVALAPFVPCGSSAAPVGSERGEGKPPASEQASDDGNAEEEGGGGEKGVEGEGEGETHMSKRAKRSVVEEKAAYSPECAAAVLQMRSDDEAVLQDLTPLVDHLQHLYPAGITPSTWHAALSCVRSRLVDLHPQGSGDNSVVDGGVMPVLLPRESGVRLWAAGNVRLQASDDVALGRGNLVALASLSHNAEGRDGSPVLGVPLAVLKGADAQLWPALQHIYCSHTCEA